MAKLTLSDLASLANQTTAISTINNNNNLIETALENTLSRDGTSPNTMNTHLDMNGFQILNVGVLSEGPNLSINGNITATGTITGDVSSSTVLASNSTTYDTLAGYLSREHWVEDYGALGDGTTNDTAAIQAAIDRCELVGGGIVRFKAKTYSVTDLHIDSTGVVLKGMAGGDLFNAATVGTILKARSGTTNVLTVGAASNASSAIRSVTVEDMTIDGNAIATRSLYIRPITNSVFRNLMIKGSTTSQLEHANYVTGAGYTGLNFMYQCHFESIFVNCGSTSAKGIVLSAIDSVSGTNGIAFCQFTQIHITHKDGTAFEINDADDNQFMNVAVSQIVGGTGKGIDIVGNVRPDLLQANMFYFCHAGTGGWRTQGSAAYDNVVFGLGQVDGSPVTITSPSWLSYIMDTGAFLFPSFSADGGAGNTIVNRLKFSGSATGSGVTLATDGTDTNIDVSISPKGSGKVKIPSAQVLIGTATATAGANNGGTGRVGSHAVAGTADGYTTTRWSADATGTPITLTKSRGATVGTHTVVQNGDSIGRVVFGGSDGTQFISAAQIEAVVDSTPGTNDMPGRLSFSTTLDGAASSTERLRISNTGTITAVTPTGGLGYGTGAGGTVTQATSKATGVTLNTVCGAITMNAAALAAATIVSFTLTNSAIAATDVLVLNHISGGTPGSYTLNAQAGAGSATINIRNNTAGSLSEAVVIQFAVIKAVNA